MATIRRSYNKPPGERPVKPAWGSRKDREAMVKARARVAKRKPTR